jgi:hypothetical protein
MSVGIYYMKDIFPNMANLSFLQICPEQKDAKGALMVSGNCYCVS